MSEVRSDVLSRTAVRRLAGLICGDDGPYYRTRRALERFFEDLGLELPAPAEGSRRAWARAVIERASSKPGQLDRLFRDLVDPGQYRGDRHLAAEVAGRLDAILALEGLRFDPSAERAALEPAGETQKRAPSRRPPDIGDRIARGVERSLSAGGTDLGERLARVVSRAIEGGLMALARSGVDRGVRIRLPAGSNLLSVVGLRHAYRAGFRLVLDESGARLEYLLQAYDDPSLLVEPTQIWSAPVSLIYLGGHFRGPRDAALGEALYKAGRIFDPIRRSLVRRRPAGADLGIEEAVEFLEKAAARLHRAGFAIFVPAELTPEGRRRLALKLRVGSLEDERERRNAGVGAAALAGLRWEVALGDEVLTEEEFRALAEAKRSIVQLRGRWVSVDPRDLEEIARSISSEGRMTVPQAAAAALAGSVPVGARGQVAEVVAEGAVADLVERLRGVCKPKEVSQPEGFEGTLRPYQLRGLAWLRHLEDSGFGGCLADDMGLGKTIQVIALLLDARNRSPEDSGPTLVLCPASVVVNWERELARFSPSIPVVRHHGPQRERSSEELKAALSSHAVVLTTYGLLRRDSSLLCKVPWTRVVLDEAQNIKNPRALQARAARGLAAAHRLALTGTPVENRLADLWSILEFANPGVLGSKERFLSRYGRRVERGDAEAAQRLRALVRPFVLRRVKSDPAVAADLPEKIESKVYCPLTPEQASLYQAAVDQALSEIDEASGIGRRGRILALLTALKQICDHPALYLGEKAPLAGRSGKLARLTEMLEEIVSENDSALVFTQFASMGRLLVAHLSETLGSKPRFLHGGTAIGERQRMIDGFQTGPQPEVFVLSLRAGGTGLNLTRATHAIHFDRWWNPAVEDQATDRIHRIGQDRTVFVHSLVAAGTLEERIDALLSAKRGLAERIVGASEGWLTDLPVEELRRVVSLSGAEIEDLSF